MRYQKQNRLWPAALFGCWAAFIVSCSMGLGPVVDLEPPSLEVINIELESGALVNLSDAARAAAQLYVSPKSVLRGEAADNVGVARIVAERIDAFGTMLQSWDKASIGSRDGSGKQQWSMVLGGIEEGEHTIRITAYDSAGNTGINSVRQLAVLVDATPPFIEDIRIQRGGGATAQLLAVDALKNFSEANYQHIDYFQNESFEIRASVDTGFTLANVTLSLNDANEPNKPVMDPLLPKNGSSLYAPVWEITEAMLTNANPAYISGKHYFRVTITANAASGLEKNTDQFLYLCWYPEADFPHVVALSADDGTGAILANKDSDLLVETFDDDALEAVYVKIFALAAWNVLAGADDQAKINGLTGAGDSWLQTNFPAYSPPISSNHWIAAPPSSVRQQILPVGTGSVGGEFRLAVLAKDKHATGKWKALAKKLIITDNEIPTITIDSPAENTAPALTNGKNFSITGNLMDNKGGLTMRAAWIPDGMSGSAADKITTAETLLKVPSQTDGIKADGIKIWNITPAAAGAETIGGNVFQKFTFGQVFNIETDFMYNGVPENESKLFVLYVRDLDGNETTREFRLLSYKAGPVITVASPANGDTYASGAAISFNFTVLSAQGLGIHAVTLVNTADPTHPLALTPPPPPYSGTFTASSSHTAEGLYAYKITAEDSLGNISTLMRNITVSQLPALNSIKTPHADNRLFNAYDNKEITIYAEFSGEVTPNTGAGIPRIKLENITNNGATVSRYANYVSKSGTQLTFKYTVQPGDSSNGIAIPYAAPLELNGGYIDAIIPGWADNSKIFTSAKTLKVDGVAPKITGVAVTGDPAKPSAYYRAGETLKATVTFDKEFMILGSPSFKLKVDSGSGTGDVDAAFLALGPSGSNTAVFQYRIAAGVNAEPVKWAPYACFSAPDLLTIVDKAGNPVVLNAAGSLTSTAVNIDTTPPVAPTLTETTPGGVRTYTIQSAGIEAGAVVEFTENNIVGVWSVKTPPSAITITANGGYNVAARQTDKAGNVSVLSTVYSFTIGTGNALSSITCDNPNGTYPASGILTFKLIFTGQVYTDGGTVSITLKDGSSTLTIPATPIASASASNFLYFPWTIPAGKVMDPVEITAVTLTGVKAASGGAPITTNLASKISEYNTARNALKVRSIAPVITAKLPAASSVSASTVNQITLTFDANVFKENGTITVKPAGNWLVPPVITNAEFAAFTSSDQTALIAGGYVKTTHGLKVSSSNYVPDTDTKYVLNFSKGLDDSTLRGIFNRAKYRWQEIDVTNPDVSISGAVVTIALDGNLPVGREWDVSISAGAFRDAAGNTSAALASGSYTFWSNKVATPVIRVNRISSNSVAMPSPPAALSGKTQFRIDSETLGATIKYGTPAPSTAAITAAMTSDATYNGGMATNGNSTISDIGTATLQGVTVGTPYAGNVEIGDDSLYSAGKYYIAAQATKTDFTASDKSYEGAFKTLLVYRNPRHDNSNRVALPGYMKVESSDTPGGQPTVAGFPLSNNDMTGKLNKLLYKTTGQSGSGDDHIWISWEIVSDWYQTAFGVTSGTADTALSAAGAKWGDGEYSFTYRKYGNYGLRVNSTVSHG